jgi:extradiol dioxygenase family protein
MQGIGFKELAFAVYSVTDFVKARQFYGEILGLKETVCLGKVMILDGWNMI